MLAGIPNIMLTTTGAKSGEARTVPLVGLDVPGGIAVIGTRFGSDHHPGWYHNLVKDPHATVEVRGTRSEVVARAVEDGAEYDAIMATADTVYAATPSTARASASAASRSSCSNRAPERVHPGRE